MHLTPRQADIVLIIRNTKHLRGFAPSIRDIAAALGISSGSTVAHIHRMANKGILKIHPRIHRGIEVVEDSAGVLAEKPKKKSVDKPANAG